MMAKTFLSAGNYLSWLNNAVRPIEIINVVVFEGELVVTYKIK